MSLVCDKCGAANADDGQFCSQCGVKLDGHADLTHTFSFTADSGDELQVDLEQLRSEGPLLIVVKGIGVGQTFSLEAGEVLIGRDPDNDIFLDDVTVSRRHAVIKDSPRGLELVDTGSLNGTYVDRERVESVVLRDRDELQIGKFKMVYIEQRGAAKSE